MGVIVSSYRFGGTLCLPNTTEEILTANRTYIGIGIVVGFVALAVLWSLFRPELLFVNATVNEALPAAVVSAPPAATSNNSNRSGFEPIPIGEHLVPPLQRQLWRDNAELGRE